MINVLLISPRLPISDRRYSGENAYTDTLLNHPPRGVRYIHYEDLLANGEVRKIRWLYRIGPRLQRVGLLPPDTWIEYLTSKYVPDVVHVHGFSAAIRFENGNRQPALVLSTSTGSYSDLKYYLQWPRRRIRRSRWAKRQYLRTVGAYDTSLNPESAAYVLVWSEFARQMHLDEGFVREHQIRVVPPGLPWRGRKPSMKLERTGVTFLFVGREFERKNGPMVLQAFSRIQPKYPDARLIVIGMTEAGKKINEPGVTHYQFLPRQEVMNRIYPQADIAVLPSKAEGFGLVLLEAMSHGLPAIGVNAWAMTEIIEDGVNGFLVSQGNVNDLAEVMKQCVSPPGILEKLQLGAKNAFDTKFDISIHNARIRSIYDSSLDGSTLTQHGVGPHAVALS